MIASRPPLRSEHPPRRLGTGRGALASGVAGGLLVLSVAAGCAGSAGVAPAEPAPSGPVAEPPAAPSASPAAAAGAQARAVPPSPSGGCGKPATAGALIARAGRLQTPYLLTLPQGYDGIDPVPLVFAFHGRTRSHQSMHDGDASHLAEKLGGQYAVAYVKSVGPGFDQPREQRDNLQIFDALYPELLASLCVDTERVFALGHSSGGLFSELLACEREPLLRGIAAVAGAMVRPACPGRSAALLVHGERDTVVSVSRGSSVRDHFLAANGCGTRATPVGESGCVRYAGCEPSLPVEWCVHAEPTYQNTNHGWPSFASAEIARFFGSLARAPRPAGAALIGNASFDTGSEPWQVTFAGSAKGRWETQRGALCATLEQAGDNPWDAQIAHPGLTLEPGRAYAVDYRLWSSVGTDVRVKLGLEAAPYDEYWQQQVAASPEPRRVADRLVVVESPPGPMAMGFQFAGSYARQVPVTLCVDEVTLTRLE